MIIEPQQNRIFRRTSITLALSATCLVASCSDRDQAQDRHLAQIEGAILYPGDWSSDGALFYATVNTGERWQVAQIETKSGEIAILDVGLAGAGVADVKSDQLLLESVEEGGSDIYVFDLTTRSLDQLTETERYEWHPAFHPTDNAIAYDAQTLDGPDIHLLDLETLEDATISGETAPEQAAQFSPDGTRVAFYRLVDGSEDNYDIVVRDLETGAERIVASSPFDDSYASWHADGEVIVFTSNRNGSFDLFLVCEGSGEIQQLTSDEGDERYPKWSPDGRSIAYQAGAENSKSLRVMNLAQLPECM